MTIGLCSYRADILDSALVRAGRFDRKVLVGLPDSDGRKSILNIHLPYTLAHSASNKNHFTNKNSLNNFKQEKQHTHTTF